MISKTLPQREIFAEAAALPPAERTAYLDRACGGQTELRADIERRLRTIDQSGFMESPAAPHTGRTTDSEFENTEADKPGDRIGNYKLLEQIGEGGFGVVWVAEQEKPLRRRVALKIIKRGMDTREVLARFDQERQALALMDHPNIARVFDAEASALGRPFFVMELVAGIKITEFCDQARLSTEERLRLFVAVCHAIQHAHQKGIIHRDLKPSNILVTLHDGEPVPKVIDFGVAKAVHEGQRLTDLTVYTKYQQMIGTPLYMSPEQAEMSGLDIDTRSDIYSLGVVLYELLTGRTPFDPQELMRKGFDEMRRTIREEEPRKPSTFVGTMAGELRRTVAEKRSVDGAKLSGRIRGDLDWIVMKSLEKDRSRRYVTANGLAEDLQRHLNDEPVLARPPSGLYRFRRFVRRNRLACGAAGMVAASILLVLAMLAVSRSRVSRERDQKDAALREKGEALSRSQASEQTAREDLFLALLNAARAGRYSRQMGERLDSLDSLSQAARIHPDDRLRDEATAAMALPDVRSGPEWRFEPGEALDAGHRISALPGPDGIITLRTIPDRRELGRIATQRPTRHLVFSRDGSLLAQTDDRSMLRIWRVSDGRSVLQGEAEPCSFVAFRPDGREVAAAREDEVICYDLSTGLEKTRWRARDQVAWLDFNPDDRRLAAGYRKSKFASVFDLEDGKELVELPLGSITGQVVAWHPDGVRLAVGGEDPRIQIWDSRRRLKLATLEGNVQAVTVLSFHPDGELLASGGWDGVNRLWQPSSGRLAMQLTCAISSFSFSSDGRWLGAVGHGETGRLLEVTPCPEYRTFVSSLGANKGSYYESDVSPDGLFAAAMEDGIRLWDLSSGREVAFQPVDRAYCVLFHENGSELLCCGPSGLIRLSIQRTGGTEPGVHFGPAKSVVLPFVPTRISGTRDGLTLAVVGRSGAAIVDLETESILNPLLPHEQSSFVAITPDGRWMATSGWHSDRVRLWDVKTGKMVAEWETPGQETRVYFSPDSRTLIVSRGDEFTFRDLESLRETRRTPRNVAQYPSPVGFSPDGKLMALEMSPGVIHLEDAATGRTVAKLQDPSGDIATSLCFTADGTRLVTVCSYAKLVHVWDLGMVRTRLKGMGLDWDWPEFVASRGTASSSGK